MMKQVKYSEVHWLHDENSRVESFGNPLSDIDFKIEKPEGTNDGLVLPLYNGWDMSQGVCKVLSVEHAAQLRGCSIKELVAKCQAERQAQIAAWEAKEETKGLAQTAKRVWFPAGKPAAVHYVGNECFRRGFAIVGVIHKRSVQPSFNGELGYDVPVIVTEFASELDRVISHARENTQKDAGRSEYAPLDYFKLAMQIVAANGGESDLVRAGVKRGTAQKVHGTARLAWKYPSVRLAERIYLPAVESIEEYSNNCYIPLSKIDKEEVRRLLNGYGPGDKGQTTPIVVTDTVIHTWLASVVTGNVKRPATMSATDIGKLKDNPCHIIQRVATAILANDAVFFATLAKHHELVNACNMDVIALFGPQPQPQPQPQAEPQPSKSKKSEQPI
jgi:hypothetical protein